MVELAELFKPCQQDKFIPVKTVSPLPTRLLQIYKLVEISGSDMITGHNKSNDNGKH